MSYRYALGPATRAGSAPPGVPAPAAGDSGAPSNRQSSRRKNYGTRGPGEQGRRGCFRKLPLGLHPSPRVPFPQPGWEGSAPRGEGAGAAGTQAIGPEPPRPARHQLLGIWRRRLRARLQLGSARPRPPPAAPAPRPPTCCSGAAASSSCRGRSPGLEADGTAAMFAPRLLDFQKTKYAR